MTAIRALAPIGTAASSEVHGSGLAGRG